MEGKQQSDGARSAGLYILSLCLGADRQAGRNRKAFAYASDDTFSFNRADLQNLANFFVDP